MNTCRNKGGIAIPDISRPQPATSEYRLHHLISEMHKVNRMSETISCRMSLALAGLARLLEA